VQFAHVLVFRTSGKGTEISRDPAHCSFTSLKRFDLHRVLFSASEFARMASNPVLFSVNHGSIRGLWQAGRLAGWRGGGEPSCTIHIGLKGLRRMLRLELFSGPSVAEPIGRHRLIRKTSTSCKSIGVAETGSSDSVTLGLLLATLNRSFTRKWALN